MTHYVPNARYRHVQMSPLHENTLYDDDDGTTTTITTTTTENQDTLRTDLRMHQISTILKVIITVLRKSRYFIEN